MCSPFCIEFGRAHLGEAEVRDRTVLEVGSLDVNGSLRGYLESLGPRRYVGVDIEWGPGVDELCDAGELVERFGASSFDLVVATELLEHVRDWQRVVHNLKRVLRPGGILLVTTRSRGFPYHAYPHDYWRYELADMRALFAELDIEALESDPGSPGVFLRASRPEGIEERDLSGHALYSIALARRIPGITDANLRFSWRYRLIQLASVIRPQVTRVLRPSVRRRIHRRFFR